MDWHLGIPFIYVNVPCKRGLLIAKYFSQLLDVNLEYPEGKISWWQIRIFSYFFLD